MTNISLIVADAKAVNVLQGSHDDSLRSELWLYCNGTHSV